MSAISEAGKKVAGILDASKPEFRILKGGRSDGKTVNDIARKHGVPLSDIKGQLAKGIKIEYEHTRMREVAQRIAMDHLAEIPDYYDRLIQMEKDAGIEDAAESSMAGVPHPRHVGQNEYGLVYEACRMGLVPETIAHWAAEMRQSIPEVSCSKPQVMRLFPESSVVGQREYDLVLEAIRVAVEGASGDPGEAARHTCEEILENARWIGSKLAR